ncbi:MAG TPA: hypothetical protein VHT52_16335 [Stellaceae bacterium]|nr:hypothetical protein [Stellaceae bacterium]
MAVAAEVVAMGRLQYVLEDWMLRSPPLCLDYPPTVTHRQRSGH